MKEISPLLLAKYFIWKNTKDPKGDLTNKKLQKLVYYSYVWYLVLNNKSLFKESIQAWIHGPAIRSLYVKYKEFGAKNIPEKVTEEELSEINENTIALLDRIWEIYGKYDANYLEVLTHNEEPWQKARQGKLAYENSETPINNEDIKNYYGKLIKQ